jgi:hypothetical protein
MGQPIHPRALLFAVLAATAPVLIAPSAQGANADYCVTCKNPDETYRCRVTGVKPNDALKLYCVIRTAKEGNHASCSAEKATTGCVGLVKIYTYDGPALPEGLTSDPRVRELNQKIERDQRAFEEPKGDEPKSLFELGGRAVSASRRGLRNAGTAIGVTSSESGTSPVAEPLPRAAPTASLPADAAPVRAAETTAPTENGETSSRVRQAAQGASSAVGGFARKSYRCMRSFFRDCSGDEEDGALE